MYVSLWQTNSDILWHYHKVTYIMLLIFNIIIWPLTDVISNDAPAAIKRGFRSEIGLAVTIFPPIDWNHKNTASFLHDVYVTSCFTSYSAFIHMENENCDHLHKYASHGLSELLSWTQFEVNKPYNKIIIIAIITSLS